MTVYVWDILVDDCSTLDNWESNMAGDSGDGEYSQVTFQGDECIKLDSGPNSAANNDYASIIRNIGALGERTILEIYLYHDLIGLFSSIDGFYVGLSNGTTRLNISFTSSGIYVHDGESSKEVGTDLVQQDTNQLWIFDINWTAKTVNIYLEGVLQASGVDCSYDVAGTDGDLSLTQRGYGTDNCITYIKNIRIGSKELSLTDGYHVGLNSYSDIVQLYPLPDYWKGKLQSTTEARLKGGGLLLYRWSNYEQVKIPVSWVTASDAALVNSWWEAGSRVQFYISSGSEIDVTSCTFMNKETPLNQYNEPHTDYFRGNILLEGY